jgi:hypothetical protein
MLLVAQEALSRCAVAVPPVSAAAAAVLLLYIVELLTRPRLLLLLLQVPWLCCMWPTLCWMPLNVCR